MINDIAQTTKQERQSSTGKAVERVAKYIRTWEERCYKGGIPDEVPVLLERSGRAPSYKAIAKCLLSNDMNMMGLGFQTETSPLYTILKREEISKRKNQTRDMFL